MGCSAKRLRRTRSGTVRPAFLGSRLLAAGLLTARIGCLSLAAPIPPLALFGGKERIAGLGHGGRKDVLAVDIHTLAGGAAELLVELGGILGRKLLYTADAE